MIDKEYDPEQLQRKVLDLAEAMDRLKNVQAERDDVVVEMKQALFARLELLAKDLLPVFNQLPPENDQFEFALTNGEVPRLWIDMTSFVRMGGDRRTYEFVKDTRLGRKILFRSDNRSKVGQAVTDYVAERQLERERAIEGDWIAMRNYDFSADGSLVSPGENATQVARQAVAKATKPAEMKRQKPARSKWYWTLMLTLGLLFGIAVALIAWAYFQFSNLTLGI